MGRGHRPRGRACGGTRDVARAPPDLADASRPGQDLDAFAADYATMLQSLAGPVRQHHLEGRTTRLPGHSEARSAAQHLVRLTRDILGELLGTSPEGR